MISVGVTSDYTNFTMNARVERLMIRTRDLTIINNSSSSDSMRLLTRSIIPSAISNISVNDVANRNYCVYRAYVRVNNACNVTCDLVLLRCEFITL